MDKRSYFLLAYENWRKANCRMVGDSEVVTYRQVAWWIYCDMRDGVPIGTNESAYRFGYSLHNASSLFIYSRQPTHNDFLFEGAVQ